MCGISLSVLAFLYRGLVMFSDCFFSAALTPVLGMSASLTTSNTPFPSSRGVLTFVSLLSSLLSLFYTTFLEPEKWTFFVACCKFFSVPRTPAISSGHLQPDLSLPLSPPRRMYFTPPRTACSPLPPGPQLFPLFGCVLESGLLRPSHKSFGVGGTFFALPRKV